MELEIVKFVQSWSNNFLDAFFYLITKMGEETFFLLILAMIYLCYSKTFTIKFSIYYLMSCGINAVVKLIAVRPRPHVASSEVVNRLPANGYSFPSGHTQSFVVEATTVFNEFSFKNNSKKSRLSVLSVLTVFAVLIMISRMYWGQHYLTDVLVGFMFGATISFVLDQILSVLPDNFKKWFTESKFYLLFGIMSIILLVVTLILEFVFGFYVNLVYKFIAVFLSLFIGYFVDKKFIHYEPNSGVFIGIIKFIIMCFVTVGLYLIFNLLLPIEGYICLLVYLFLGLICTIILPFVYKKIFNKDKK